MKQLALEELVRRYIHDGMSVLIGASHEALIPFAVVYEIVRQGIRDLTVIAPISDIALDLMIGTGAVRAVKTAWIGNVSGGLGHAYRRAVEQHIPHPIEVWDYSNYTLALALEAAAMGVPFLPTRSLLGTDLLDSRVGFERFDWRGQSLVAVPALTPDLTVVAVQTADSEGNLHIDGPIGMARSAVMASKHTIAIAETMMSARALRQQPELVSIPGFMVDAVAWVPFGAHPSPVLGYYGRDTAFFQAYHQQTRSVQGFEAWTHGWIHAVGNHEGYLEKLGPTRLNALRDETGVSIWENE
jgi:glutaconate CoA-transferase subunit A